MGDITRIEQDRNKFKKERDAFKAFAQKHDLWLKFKPKIETLNDEDERAAAKADATIAAAKQLTEQVHYDKHDPDGAVSKLNKAIEDETQDSAAEEAQIAHKQATIEADIQKQDDKLKDTLHEIQLFEDANEAELNRFQATHEQASQAHGEEVVELKANIALTQFEIEQTRTQCGQDEKDFHQIELQLDQDHLETKAQLVNDVKASDDQMKQTQSSAEQKALEHQAAKQIIEDECVVLQEAIDGKQCKHEEACRDQNVRATQQAERIRILKEFPRMIADYKRSEDEIVKYEYSCMETEQRVSDLRRKHYLGTSTHKERLFFLEKELERARSHNYRISNRIAYSLRDPMGI